MIAKDREVIDKLVITGNKLKDTIKNKKQNPEELEGVANDLHMIIEELRIVTSGFKLEEKPSGEQEESSKDVEQETT